MSMIESRLIIKQGYMVKRSQNKRVYTLVNFKRRWFVLTKTHLIYYDDEDETVSAPAAPLIESALLAPSFQYQRPLF